MLLFRSCRFQRWFQRRVRLKLDFGMFVLVVRMIIKIINCIDVDVGCWHLRFVSFCVLRQFEVACFSLGCFVASIDCLLLAWLLWLAARLQHNPWRIGSFSTVPGTYKVHVMSWFQYCSRVSTVLVPGTYSNYCCVLLLRTAAKTSRTYIKHKNAPPENKNNAPSPCQALF